MKSINAQQFSWIPERVQAETYPRPFSRGALILKAITPLRENRVWPRETKGRRESLRGPGQNIRTDCFNRVFDCSIRVYRSFEALKQSGPGQNTPVAPPPLYWQPWPSSLYEHVFTVRKYQKLKTWTPSIFK